MRDLVLCRRFGEDEVKEDRWKMLKDTAVVVVVVIKAAATKERQVLGSDEQMGRNE